MDDRLAAQLAAARAVVRARFPELAAVEPSVSHQADGGAVFAFRGRFRAADGVELMRLVRVTVDDRGNVVKVSASRG